LTRFAFSYSITLDDKMQGAGGITMSNREKCYAIIDSFTEEQLAAVAALLSTAKTLADDCADDAYCLRLYDDYQADPDKGEPQSIEDFARSLGISL
jgi:hypothetical protein